MRLICPKCTAAYDIPAKAIPLDGREVQCSSCTHTWYQLPPDETAPQAPLSLQSDKLATSAPPTRGLTPIHLQEKEAERISKQIERLRGALSQEPQLPHQHAAKQSSNAPKPRATEATLAPWAKDDGPPPPPRRKIDPQVLEVLRAEAVRESRARKADPAPLMDSQPDLGLRPPTKRPARKTEGIREKLARLQAAEREIGQPTPWVRSEEEQMTPPKSASDDPTRKTEAPKTAAETETSKPEPKDTSKETVPTSNDSPRKTVLVRTKGVAGLPVALSSRELALIVEKQERIRFRWGFGATAGVCCFALVVYLAAAPLARSLPNEQHLLELVAEKGAVVQSKLATGVRAAIAALGANGSDEG